MLESKNEKINTMKRGEKRIHFDPCPDQVGESFTYIANLSNKEKSRLRRMLG